MNSLATLQVDHRHAQREITELKQAQQELKEQILASQRIVETLSSHNNSLTLKNQEQEQQVGELQQRIETIRAENKQQVEELSRENESIRGALEQQLQTVTSQSQLNKGELEHELDKMRAKLKYLEETRRGVEEREELSRQEALFKGVVEEVCDEFEDYREVLGRVQHLEKYRSEYYFNTEKIQYLCKMLDS